MRLPLIGACLRGAMQEHSLPDRAA